MARCRLCGTENAPTQSSCVACGQQLDPPAPAAGGGSGAVEPTDAGTVASGGPRASTGPTKQTLLGMPSPFAQPASKLASPQAAPPPALGSEPAPPPAPELPARVSLTSGKQTLLGYGAFTPPPAPLDLPEPTDAPEAPLLGGKKTLLGVAQPGIAPSASAAPVSGAPVPVRGGGTLLGVARPGVAPTGRAAPPPELDQAPAPSAEVPGPPLAPRRRRPLLALIGALGAIALGALVFALWPRSTPRVEVDGLRVGATGDEIVVSCTDCAEGTTVSLGKNAVKFENGKAVVKTDTPLTVGEHRLGLTIVRPNGAASKLEIEVPVAFRARAVLDHLGDDTPSASVEVSAPPGSKVTVAGTPVALNAQGAGKYELDLTKQTVGEEASSLPLSQTLDVSVTSPDGGERRSTVELRSGVTPLVTQAPGPRVVIGGGDLILSGRTSPFASVRLGDARGKADKDGRFVVPVRAPKPGKYTLHSTGEHLATRSITIEIASAPSPAPPLSGYDALRGSLGKRVAVRGRVVDARAQTEGSSFLLEVKEGCQSAPCLVGALYPARLVAGMPVRDRDLTVVGDVTSAADGSPRLRVETFAR